MVLGAGRGQVPMIRAACEDGLEVVAVDPSRDAPGLRLADHAYCHDLADVDAVLRAATRHGISGIATLGADYPMPVLAQVCAALGLPGPVIDAVHRATNKWLMRAAFQSAGLTAGFDAALAATREDAVLVEEFVEGPEFSVEAITWRGMTRVVAVTDKLTSGAPHFVELGHSQPSRFGQADLDALRSTAIAAVAALGIDDAASHTEIRLGAAGPRIMESAARLGGGFINSHLVPASCGVDIVRAAIAVALGREPDLEPRALQGSAIRFLTAPPGRIESVDGLDVARSMPGVMEAVSYVSRGDEFGALRDASGRLGHVIARGATASEAVRRAESALAALHVRTRPAPRVGSHD